MDGNLPSGWVQRFDEEGRPWFDIPDEPSPSASADSPSSPPPEVQSFAQKLYASAISTPSSTGSESFSSGHSHPTLPAPVPDNYHRNAVAQMQRASSLQANAATQAPRNVTLKARPPPSYGSLPTPGHTRQASAPPLPPRQPSSSSSTSSHSVRQSISFAPAQSSPVQAPGPSPVLPQANNAASNQPGHSPPQYRSPPHVTPPKPVPSAPRVSPPTSYTRPPLPARPSQPQPNTQPQAQATQPNTSQPSPRPQPAYRSPPQARPSQPQPQPQPSQPQARPSPLQSSQARPIPPQPTRARPQSYLAPQLPQRPGQTNRGIGTTTLKVAGGAILSALSGGLLSGDAVSGIMGLLGLGAGLDTSSFGFDPTAFTGAPFDTSAFTGASFDSSAFGYDPSAYTFDPGMYGTDPTAYTMPSGAASVDPSQFGLGNGFFEQLQAVAQGQPGADYQRVLDWVLEMQQKQAQQQQQQGPTVDYQKILEEMMKIQQQASAPASSPPYTSAPQGHSSTPTAPSYAAPQQHSPTYSSSQGHPGGYTPPASAYSFPNYRPPMPAGGFGANPALVTDYVNQVGQNAYNDSMAKMQAMLAAHMSPGASPLHAGQMYNPYLPGQYGAGMGGVHHGAHVR